MAQITVTRHYSGFQNREDTFALGDHEADGDASATAYELPEGYAIHHGYAVDPVGFRCEIVLDHASNRPCLMSLAGPTIGAPVLVPVADTEKHAQDWADHRADIRAQADFHRAMRTGAAEALKE